MQGSPSSFRQAVRKQKLHMLEGCRIFNKQAGEALKGSVTLRENTTQRLWLHPGPGFPGLMDITHRPTSVLTVLPGKAYRRGSTLFFGLHALLSRFKIRDAQKRECSRGMLSPQAFPPTGSAWRSHSSRHFPTFLCTSLVGAHNSRFSL